MHKVSVVVPYYNREDVIIRAVGSIVQQSYRDFEIILIDDGSTDDTHEILEDFIKDYPEISFKHLYEENKGPSSARNKGIREAEGEYIAFLDSDDSWDRDKLQIQIEYMQKNKDVMITSTNYRIITDGEVFVKYKLKETYKEANFYKMLFKVFYCIPTTVIRSDIFKKGKLYFKDGKNHAEDNLLFLQITRKYRGVKINKPLANIYKYEFGEGGLSEDLKELKKQELDNFSILYKENKYNNRKICLILYRLTLLATYLKNFKRIFIARVLRKL